MVNNFRPFPSGSPEEESQLKITSELTLFLKMLEKLIQGAQNSIDMIVPVEKIEVHLFGCLPYFNEAMRRGVKIRLITQKAEVGSTPRKPKALEENVLFELKYLSNLVPFGTRWFGLHIFDKKENDLMRIYGSCRTQLVVKQPTTFETIH